MSERFHTKTALRALVVRRRGQDVDPAARAMRPIDGHVIARAEADPALAPCIGRSRPGRSVPLAEHRDA